MDLSKLAPLPLTEEPGGRPEDACTLRDGHGNHGGTFNRRADAAFHVLARRAFDVMVRRGWSPLKSPVEGEGWRVDTDDGEYFALGGKPLDWPDPFTALVEADRLAGSAPPASRPDPAPR